MKHGNDDTNTNNNNNGAFATKLQLALMFGKMIRKITILKNRAYVRGYEVPYDCDYEAYIFLLCDTV
jgi:hypothetical protein